ncbi:MAG: NUDIX hydrolase [Clostridiales bacterium]|nr:NUDIX hydrolase [Clostridiales bacterium]
MEFYEKQVSSERVFSGRVINVRCDMVELINGKHVSREVVEHPGGVAIVPLAENGDVLMVRQYRYCVSDELLEIPAGKLEEGEDPFDCAVRELSEETGCRAGRIVPLGAMYTSPGFSRETLYIYLATQLEEGQCHPDEDEFLSVVRVPFEEVVDKIMSGEIKDGKTIVGILKAKVFLGK